MKLKKKTILYLEGMLNKNQEEEYKRDIQNRHDLTEFIRIYRWIEKKLKLYFNQYPKEDSVLAYEREINRAAIADIQKYLKNYTSPPLADEEIFLKKVREASGSNKSFFHRNSSLIVNVAAGIALAALITSALLHIYTTRKNLKVQTQLFTHYFQPMQDPYLKTLNPDLYAIPGNEVKNPTGRNSGTLPEYGLILRNGHVKPEDLLLASAILIQKDELIMAETYLKGLLEDTVPPLSDAVHWYMAMLKLNEGKAAEAVHYLKVLCKKSSGYSVSSCAILQALEKMGLD